MMCGGRIITEDGAGILLLGGRGCRTIHGDGVSPIMEGGTGDGVLVGTGYRRESGDLLGSTGAGGTIMSGGVRSAIMGIPWWL